AGTRRAESASGKCAVRLGHARGARHLGAQPGHARAGADLARWRWTRRRHPNRTEAGSGWLGAARTRLRHTRSERFRSAALVSMAARPDVGAGGVADLLDYRVVRSHQRALASGAAGRICGASTGGG